MKFAKGEDYYKKTVLKDRSSWSADELVKEADRLSKEVNKRLERLEKYFPRSRVVQEREKSLPGESFVSKGGRIDRNAISSQIVEDYRFLNSPTSTLTGFRKQLSQSIRHFNETVEGRPFTKKNIWDYYDFLEDLRERYKNQVLPSSDEVVDIYTEAVRLNIDRKDLVKNMDFWAEHYDDMTKLKVIRSDKPVSSSKYEKLI